MNTPRWFSRVAVDYPYTPDCGCPSWLEFLEKCLEDDSDRIALLQEWFGYCLVYDTTQQKAMFFEGDGANGKSVAALTLEHVVGADNCSHVPLEIFGHRFQLTPTLGKLVNICGDTGEIDKAAEGYIKQFTGGDVMYFDRKCISGVEAIPTARLHVLMNNRPRFSDRSDGIWRRIILMPWKVTIPEEDQNKLLLLPDSPEWPFRPELPGIFNWAIDGLRRLREQGHFTDPDQCRTALQEYKRESNPAHLFLNECCQAVTGGRTPVLRVYQDYRHWCDSRGYRPLGEAGFGKEVHRRLPHVIKTRPTIKGQREFCYEGLELIGDRSQVSQESRQSDTQKTLDTERGEKRVKRGELSAVGSTTTPATAMTGVVVG